MPMTSTTPRVRPSPTNGHNCRRLFRGRRSISAALRPPLLDCSRAVTGSVRCATSQSPPHGWMPGQLHEPAFGTSRPSEVDRDCSAGQRSRAVQRHPGSPLVSAPSAPPISEHVADAAALAHVHLRGGQVDTRVLPPRFGDEDDRICLSGWAFSDSGIRRHASRDMTCPALVWAGILYVWPDVGWQLPGVVLSCSSARSWSSWHSTGVRTPRVTPCGRS
jgi:hypothetical protein